MRLHSLLSAKCEIRNSNIAGRGVFANEEIQKYELIAVWGGIVYTTKEIDELSKKYPHFSTHAISVYEGFHLGPVSTTGFDDTELFNHSCEPNIGIKGQIIVLARRQIKKEEELCMDYDTTEINGGWFNCKCKSKHCRKKIDGNAWKDKEFIKNNKGFLSWFIEDKIRNEKA